MANKTFNNIQIFENFLHDVQNGVWGETKQPPEVLFSNLDPSGNTNLAVELAKIYSWATEMFDFQPYTLLESQPSGTWDPTQHYKIVNGRYVRGTAGDPWATDTWYDLSEQPIMIDESALPELGHTYEFRTSTSDMAAFDVREDGGAWQSIAVKLVDTDGKVFEAVLPKYRCVPAHESSAPAAAGSYDGFLLQISRNWQLPVEQQTWTTVSDIDLNLFSTSTSGKEEAGKIRSALLPSYVDDIVEGYFNYDLLTTQPASFDPTKYYKLVDGKYVKGTAGEAWAANTWYTPHFYEEAAHTHVIPGESDKIYVDDATGRTYRCVPGTPEVWVDISNPLSAAEIYELLDMPSDGNFSTSKHGLVPAASGTGDTAKFLRGDGTWATPTDTKYALSGTTYGTNDTTQIVTLKDTNNNPAGTATIQPMTAAGASTAGKAGLVPKPAAGDNTKFLTGAGTWATPTDTKYALNQGPLYDSNNTYQEIELQENGSVKTPRAKVAAMTGANGSVAGKAGLAPKPAAADNIKYLRGDATYADPFTDQAARTTAGTDVLILNCNHNSAYDPT